MTKKIKAAPVGLPLILVRSRYAKSSDLLRSARKITRVYGSSMQPLFSCVPSVYAEIEGALTQVRISRYLAAAKNDKQLALRLYVWNARLCECLYLPVQFTEVAVRNAVMRRYCGVSRLTGSKDPRSRIFRHPALRKS